MKLIQEFRAFALRGNVVDLAIAVVIGGAFGKIVSSLVDTILMPTIGLLLGGVDFTSYSITIGKSTLAYGAFMQAVIDFVIIALVIFLAVKAMNRFKKKEEAASVEPTEEIRLLREIRDSLKK